MRHDNVFNSHKSRLMRTHIPGSENLSVALIFIALIALGVWVMTTRDDFDPTERDLPIELLGDNSLQIDIYNRPLKPWVEPGQQLAGAAFDLGPFPPPTLDADWQPVGRVKRFQADQQGPALDTLLAVFELEASDRHQRRINRLRRAAKLPAGKTWERLDRGRFPAKLQQQLEELLPAGSSTG